MSCQQEKYQYSNSQPQEQHQLQQLSKQQQQHILKHIYRFNYLNNEDEDKSENKNKQQNLKSSKNEEQYQVYDPLDCHLKPVQNFQQFPYSNIIIIQVNFNDQNNSTVYGTGVLINPQIAITCAHIFCYQNYKYKTKIYKQKTQNSQRLFQVQNVVIHKKYFSSQKKYKYDIAIIKTKESIIQDTKFQYPTIRANSQSEQYKRNYNQQFLISGFPQKDNNKNIPDMIQYQDQSPSLKLSQQAKILLKQSAQNLNNQLVFKQTKYLFNHHIHTDKGESGAPLWSKRNKNDKFQIIGIHLGGNLIQVKQKLEKTQFIPLNHALKINDKILQFLQFQLINFAYMEKLQNNQFKFLKISKKTQQVKNNIQQDQKIEKGQNIQEEKKEKDLQQNNQKKEKGQNLQPKKKEEVIPEKNKKNLKWIIYVSIAIGSYCIYKICKR